MGHPQSRRRSLSQLERAFPILRVHEVNPDPVTEPERRAMDRNPMIRAGRAIEARHDRESAAAQRLSRDLAHLYRRDVFCEGAISEGKWAEQRRDGAVLWHRDDPSRRFLLESAYFAVKVAPDVAVRLLARDKDMPVPLAWHPNPVRPEKPPEFKMPTLADMLSVGDDD